MNLRRGTSNAASIVVSSSTPETNGVATPPEHAGPALPLHGKPHTFVALDGLRGVAAFAVILFHLPGLLGPVRLPHGYLAVDFFFMLSGFVLAYAYGDRLDRGWPTRAFLLVRFIRLYPLYAFSMVLGLLVVLTPWAWQPAYGSPARLLHRLVLGLLFVPSFVTDYWLFPLNFPSWSILLEGLANVGHALFLRRRSAWMLAAVALAGAAGTMFCGLRVGHLNFGAFRPIASYAVFRLVFGYVVGILLYRGWRTRVHRRRLPAGISTLLLCATFALPLSLSYLVAVDLACVFVVFPPLVLAAAASKPGARTASLLRKLGQLSYPLYLLHMPLFMLVSALWPHVPSKSAANPNLMMGALYFPLLIGLAEVVSRLFDAPVRALLTQHLRRFAR